MLRISWSADLIANCQELSYLFCYLFLVLNTSQNLECCLRLLWHCIIRIWSRKATESLTYLGCSNSKYFYGRPVRCKVSTRTEQSMSVQLQSSWLAFQISDGLTTILTDKSRNFPQCLQAVTGVVPWSQNCPPSKPFLLSVHTHLTVSLHYRSIASAVKMVSFNNLINQSRLKRYSSERLCSP